MVRSLDGVGFGMGWAWKKLLLFCVVNLIRNLLKEVSEAGGAIESNGDVWDCNFGRVGRVRGKRV